MHYRYPNVAELAYGSRRRGCFENPDDNREPQTELDCPDILPVEHQEDIGHLHDPMAMKNPSQLVRIQKNHPNINTANITQVHPDVRGTNRFVTGTRLQMRKAGTSHKRPSCRFHDVSKTKQGVFINTMNQVGDGD